MTDVFCMHNNVVHSDEIILVSGSVQETYQTPMHPVAIHCQNLPTETLQDIYRGATHGPDEGLLWTVVGIYISILNPFQKEVTNRGQP